MFGLIEILDPWKNCTKKGEKSGSRSDGSNQLVEESIHTNPVLFSLSECYGKIRSDGFKIFI